MNPFLFLLPALTLGVPCPTCAPAHVSNKLVTESEFVSQGPAVFHDGANFGSEAAFAKSVTVSGNLTVLGSIVNGSGSAVCGCAAGSGQAVGPRSCAEILDLDPAAPSGVYEIQLQGRSVEVRCNMTHLGGGWTEIGRVSLAGRTRALDISANFWDHGSDVHRASSPNPDDEFWLPMSEFAEDKYGMGEDVEVLVTVPAATDQATAFVGMTNRCVWGKSWYDMALVYLSGSAGGWCYPRSVPSVGIREDGTIHGDCYAEYLGSSSDRRFLMISCAAAALFKVHTTTSDFMSMGSSMTLSFNDALFGVYFAKFSWAVRPHRKSWHVSNVGTISKPTLLNHLPLGLGPLTDVEGSLAALTETGSIPRVSDACGTSSQGAVAISSNADYLEHGHAPSLHFSGSFTISLWFKRTSDVTCCNEQTVMAYRHGSIGGNNGWELSLTSSGLNFRLAGAFGERYSSAYGLIANRWYRLVLGYTRGSSGSSNLAVYDASGSLVTNAVDCCLSDNPVGFESTGNVFRVGSHPNPFGARTFETGFEVDDIRFFSGAESLQTRFKDYIESDGTPNCPA